MAFHVCAEFGLQCDMVLSLAITGIVVVKGIWHCCHDYMHVGAGHSDDSND